MSAATGLYFEANTVMPFWFGFWRVGLSDPLISLTSVNNSAFLSFVFFLHAFNRSFGFAWIFLRPTLLIVGSAIPPIDAICEPSNNS